MKAPRLSDFVPPPPIWLMLAEGRALLESTTLVPLLPLLRNLPRGDGHPVLVLPGFLATSRSTLLLRSFLRHHGYAAHRWKLGRNRGYRPELERAMAQRVLELNERYGRRVSLLGWSLGGIYARELARDMPDRVRQVITLGSPFAAEGNGTNVRWLYELVSGHSPIPDSSLLRRMRAPPPVPTTAIFSRTDGIASWRATVEHIAHDHVENVEVGGAHIGLGFNPRAYYVIADRLALPEGEWRPFSPRGWWRLLFPEMHNITTHGPGRRLEDAAMELSRALDALENRLHQTDGSGRPRQA